MKKYLILAAAPVAAAVLAVAIVCFSVLLKDESELAPFKQVTLALEDDDPQVGLAALEYYLRINPESAQAHLMLANLYDERLDMPLEAIYHYQKYLRLAPDPDRAAAELWIQADRRKCVEKWVEDHGFDLSSLLDREFIELKNENRELRDQIAAYDRAALVAPAQPDAAPQADAATQADAAPQPVSAAAPEAARERLYTVRKGESLGTISRKFYGDAKYFKVIYDHNRDALKSPDSLRAGQTLKIPAFTPPPAAPAPAPAPEAEVPRQPLAPIPPLTPEQLKKIRPNAAALPAPKPQAAPEPPEPTPEKRETGGRTAEPSAGITPYLYGQ